MYEIGNVIALLFDPFFHFLIIHQFSYDKSRRILVFLPKSEIDFTFCQEEGSGRKSKRFDFFKHSEIANVCKI